MENTVTKSVESVEMEQFATVLMECARTDVKITGYYLTAQVTYGTLLMQTLYLIYININAIFSVCC